MKGVSSLRLCSVWALCYLPNVCADSAADSAAAVIREDVVAGTRNRPIETFDIDLDLPPKDRWKEVMTQRGEAFLRATDWVVENEIPKGALSEFIAAFDLVEDFWPTKEYREELVGIAGVVDMHVGMVLALNLIYELTTGCTSIVARSSDGTIWHGRNLDYDIPHLQDLTIYVRFLRGGKLMYEGTTYAGYIGISTGMKRGAFSLSQDQRDTGTPVWENLIEFLIQKGKAAAYPFLFRDVLATIDDYDTALEVLQETPMMAPAYAILAGASKGQGAVVTRDRNAAVDTWRITDDEWFLVETNDDHWKPPTDDRRDAARHNMQQYNPDTMEASAMMAVMNLHPTLNSMTTYTAVMSAGNNYYRNILQNGDGFEEDEPLWTIRQY